MTYIYLDAFCAAGKDALLATSKADQLLVCGDEGSAAKGGIDDASPESNTRCIRLKPPMEITKYLWTRNNWT